MSKYENLSLFELNEANVMNFAKRNTVEFAASNTELTFRVKEWSNPDALEYVEDDDMVFVSYVIKEILDNPEAPDEDAYGIGIIAGNELPGRENEWDMFDVAEIYGWMYAFEPLKEPSKNGESGIAR